MLDLSLVEVKMNRWSPSLLACAAIFVSKKILSRDRPWSKFMSQQTNQTEQEVRDCAKDLCFIINIAHVKRHYQAAFKKYSLPQFHGVALVCKGLSESVKPEE